MAAARETHVSEAMSPFEDKRDPARRRVVAVALTAMELLRPESDMARLIGGFDHADVLVVADDATGSGDVLRSGVAQLRHAGLYVHRLALQSPVDAGDEGDLVAAMSELVGFDPEPGVYCLAPAPSLRDPARVAVSRAAQRIAQVYGIPLLRYRCLELSVVDAP
jgi:hypothetical protein